MKEEKKSKQVKEKELYLIEDLKETYMLSHKSAESIGGVSLGGLSSLGVNVGNIDLKKLRGINSVHCNL